MNEQTMNEVRVITDSGELVAYTDHLDDEQAAREDFTGAVTELLPGQIAQLIVDDLIAAQHAPSSTGPSTPDRHPPRGGLGG